MSSSSKHVIVTRLPCFASKECLMRYFSGFGTVKSACLLSNKVGDYTRSAVVEMGSEKLVQEILKEVEHRILGRPVVVKEYHEHESKEIEQDVENAFSIELSGLFKPSGRNQRTVDKMAREAYKKLDEAFWELDYTRIRILYGDAFPKLNGSATVDFPNDVDKEKIREIATGKLDCTIFAEWKVVWYLKVNEAELESKTDDDVKPDSKTKDEVGPEDEMKP